jgi:AraC family transcriptional regulator of adaptative response/methylated-DNA-[protein]-cysteine methyltransferase
VCAVKLGDDATALETDLAEEYPAATRARVSAPSSSLASWVEAVVATIDGGRARSDVPLDVQGSAFQWKVWRELQNIPLGETRSYSEIATAIGSPKAIRAVGSACANNRVAVVVPCHRAVRLDGGFGGYRWGVERKRQLLEKEQATREKRTS